MAPLAAPCASLPPDMIRRSLRLVLGLALFNLLHAQTLALQANPRPLRIATWNLQWLLDPETMRQARIACRDGVPTALPCDVVREVPRNSADLRRLAAYARELDADVIAFQEVENAAIARRIFRGYEFCLQPGPGLQQTGFALRAGLVHQCGPALTALAMGGRGRAGQTVNLEVPGLGTIVLLAVHLKSGCAHDPLPGGSEACLLLSEQARELGRWIAAQAGRGAPFIVLGDFNRGGPPGPDDPFWAALGPTTFLASSEQLPFANCSPGAPYRDFIDHILVSHSLVPALAPGAFSQLTYRPADAARYLISDHCPIGVSLSAPTDL